MSISSLVNRIVPTATAFVTSGFNPAAAFATAVQTDKALDQAKKIRLRNEEITNQIKEQQKMAFGDPNIPGAFPTPRPANLGQPSFFSRLGNIGSTIGDTLLTGLESAVPSVLNRAIFGESRPRSAAQGPALTTITNVGAQESQSSGTVEAGMGAALPSIVNAARNLLKSPGGQLAIGTGTGLAFSMGGSQQSGMRITRKMKSQARMVLNMAGGNLGAAADMLGIDQNTLVMILLKRFRNDGPVVTKAALRKTKQTIRRLHSMQDVLKSITPTATMRRRAPMRRASTTTLIKN